MNLTSCICYLHSVYIENFKLLLSAKKQTLESIVFAIRHLTKFKENGAYSKGGSIG